MKQNYSIVPLLTHINSAKASRNLFGTRLHRLVFICRSNKFVHAKMKSQKFPRINAATKPNGYVKPVQAKTKDNEFCECFNPIKRNCEKQR